MKVISIKALNLLLCALLFIYALFYHISSSEFWPITISKTWFIPTHFEYSMLQKPLFSFFLSLFHFLPLTDVVHLYLLKGIFAAFGLLSLWLMAKAFGTKSQQNLSFFIVLIISFLSPTLLQNFFRIRADQLSLLFFASSLYFFKRRNQKYFLISLGLLFLTSIKSILFLGPCLLFFAKEINFYLSKKTFKTKFLIALSLLAIFIWILAFNINSLYYLFEIENFKKDYNIYLKQLLLTDWPILLFATLSSYFIFKKSISTVLSAVFSLLIILLWPQPLPFFIASFLLILYIPILQFLLITNDLNLKKKKLLILVALIIQMTNLVFLSENKKIIYFTSNQYQMTYINKVSALIKKHNLTYMDGMGILPRENFLPCFISPNDDVTNSNCRQKLINHEADSYIITQRLSFLGAKIYPILDKNYTQIMPNLWVKNIYLPLIEKKETELPKVILPILIFGFD